MSVVTIRVEVLKAVAPFISKEETRYYLRGAFFSKGLVVTTDGHRLAALNPVNDPNDWAAESPDFILPEETIKKIMSVKPSGKYAKLFVALDTKTNIATVFEKDKDNNRDTKAAFPYEPIDGTYPDFRRVIPKPENFLFPRNLIKEGGTEIKQGFNSKYLGEFSSFGKEVTLYMNIEQYAPCLFRAKTEIFDAVGVLMPMRVSYHEGAIIPDWLKPAKAEGAKA